MFSRERQFFHQGRSFGKLFRKCVTGLWVLFVLILGTTAAAAQSAPTLTRLPVSPGSTPFIAAANDLAARGYVEEEYLVTGIANIYEYDANKQIQIQTPDVSYETRILIRRPAQARKFNGTVIFEWMNPTPGFDLDAMWIYTADHILQRGYAWVGITVRPTAVGFLKAWNPARYGSLNMSDIGLIYDAVSRLGVLLRDANSPQNPLSGLGVRRMFGTGYSASAHYLVTYINEFHNDAALSDGSPAFDGYLVSGAFALARQINSTSGDLFDKRRFVNAPVPVIRIQSETEVELGSATTRLPDTGLYRTYEFAGTSHIDEEFFRIFSGPGSALVRDIPAFPPIVCQNPDNPLAFSPFQRAALANLNLWVRYGIEPPPALLIALDNAGEIVRDTHGNAKADLRPPGLDAPLGSHFPLNGGSIPICALSGSFFAFDENTLRSLYPNHGRYVSKVTRSAIKLFLSRYLLIDDAENYITEAARSSVGR